MRSYKYLGLITAVYVTFLIISSTTAGKLISVFGYVVSVTVIYFPLTYILDDILTEVYGYARARSVVWVVFFCSVITGILYQLVVLLPPASGFMANEAYITVLSTVPRILIGGWIASWTGSILNDVVLAKMKLWTKGKHLWSRTISSTVVGEFANTALFYTIGLYGILPTNILITSIIAGWLIKVGVEVVLTPVTYLVVGWLKKKEDEDYFDQNTDFNPLIIETTRL
jgi:uncharacterized integral membrane protein (TIGR00697 family)